MFVAFCFAFFTIPGSSAQVDESATVPLAERVAISSKIYADIRLYFAHWAAIPEYDLDAAYNGYLERILQNDDRKNFDLEAIAFIASLHNGHSRFSDTWLVQNYGQGLNFYARPIDGRWTVTESA